MQLDQIKKTLRDVKLRPTRQRIALASLLFGGPDQHVTAEMLFAKVGNGKVRMSLATVYNALHVFTDAGLLRRVHAHGLRFYFDTNITPHHHFFNERTGELFDIPETRISVSCLREAPVGTEVERVEVIVHLKKVDEASNPQGRVTEYERCSSRPALESKNRAAFSYERR